MKTFFSALASCTLALAIGLAATSSIAHANQDYKSAYKDMKKKYDKLKEKFDQREADHIIKIKQLQDQAIAQITAVHDACAAKLGASPSPTPTSSDQATTADEGTVVSESAVGAATAGTTMIGATTTGATTTGATTTVSKTAASAVK